MDLERERNVKNKHKNEVLFDIDKKIRKNKR